MPLGAFAPLPLRLGGPVEESFGSPEQHARLCADLLAVKRTAALAAWNYTVDGTDATMLAYLGQNGSGLAYAPTATRNGTGDVSFQWPMAAFEDEYGIQYPFKVLACIVTALETTAVGTVWEPIARGVRVRRITTAGAADNGVGLVRVW